MITEIIKQRVLDALNPEVLEISQDEYAQLVEAIPPNLRYKRNDGTENIIFPVFSNTVIYPKGSVPEEK